MATENTTTLPQRGCPKDCRRCSYVQQMFCAAQLSFDAFGVMNSIYTKLDEIEAKVKSLCDEMDALHPADELVSPASKTPE